jgi:hypothetical protein
MEIAGTLQIGSAQARLSYQDVPSGIRPRSDVVLSNVD